MCCPIWKEKQLKRNSAALALLLLGPGGMLHLFGGWYFFLIPLYLWTVQHVTPGKNTQQRPHNCILSDFLENKLPFQVLLCWLRAANDLFPAQRMETCVLRTLMFAGKGLKPQLCSQTYSRCFLIPTNLKILLGWGQGPPAWAESQAVVLLFGWLILLPHWFSASVTLWTTSGLYWSRESSNITSGSIVLHWKSLKADYSIKAVTVLM